jgi:hypothetical protein
MLFEALKYCANVFVEIRDHGGISGPGAWVGKVTILSSIGSFLLVPFFWIPINPFLRRMHRDVGFDERKVEKERLIFIFIEEF